MELRPEKNSARSIDKRKKETNRIFLFLVSCILSACCVFVSGCSVQSNSAFPDVEAAYFGNSYTIGTGSTSKHDGLYETTRSLFGDSMMTCGSGTGFAPYFGVDKFDDPEPASFTELFEDRAEDLGEQAKSVGVVIIVSAMGDTRAFSQDPDTYKNYLEQGISKVKELFPNAIILVYYAEGIESETNQKAFSEAYSNNQILLDNLFSQCADNYGYTYLGWGGKTINGDSSFFSQDGYHPNDHGYEILAADLRDRIKTALEAEESTQ